jgi:hypothetical protein
MQLSTKFPPPSLFCVSNVCSFSVAGCAIAANYGLQAYNQWKGRFPEVVDMCFLPSCGEMCHLWNSSTVELLVAQKNHTSTFVSILWQQKHQMPAEMNRAGATNAASIICDTNVLSKQFVQFCTCVQRYYPASHTFFWKMSQFVPWPCFIIIIISSQLLYSCHSLYSDSSASTSSASDYYARNFYDGPFENKMTRREAALILGVRESASPERVKSAHRTLLIQNHPDTGGSTFLATKINEAKELLMSGKRERDWSWPEDF